MMNIEEHLPFVKGLAKKMAQKYGRSDDLQDLVQVGSIGLMEALENYTPQDGVKLCSYLYNRVNGSFIDHFRSMDWASRSHRREQKEMREVEGRLQQKLGRKPIDSELASALNLELSQLQKRIAESRQSEILNYDSNEDLKTVFELTPAGSQYEPMNILQEKQKVASFLAALEQLPERTQKVMHGVYVEDMKMEDIGTRLGLTTSRVCQLHKAAVSSLREQLSERSYLAEDEVKNGK
jgi:RNA polymerase sigma factor, sigma-70 family